jgi:hypothetical protein
MPTPHRRCSTCRHFQPAPLWRKGWCRNPLLYSATQNHLVDERDLDCNRQLGDYWEPIESAVVEESVAAEGGTGTDALPPLTDEPILEPVGTARATGPRTSAPPRPFPPLRRPGSANLPARGPADYLRLIMPVVLILVVLGGYAIWTGLLFREAAATPVGTPATVPTAPPEASPTSAATVMVAAATATVAPTPRPTSPPAATTAPTAPPSTPTAAAATQPPAGLRAGGTAVVDTGAGNDNLRLRRDPGRTGVILRSIKNGERVTLVEGPRDVDGQTWWKVEYAGEAGWVAASFLRPAS